MESDEEVYHHSIDDVSDNVPSISDDSTLLDYASPSTFDVKHCGPDVLTASGNTMMNGVNFCLGDYSPDNATSLLSGKSDFLSKNIERRDISVDLDCHSSSSFENLGSVAVVCPPDIITSSGRIVSADLGGSYDPLCVVNDSPQEVVSYEMPNNDPHFQNCASASKVLQPHFHRENIADEMPSEEIIRDSEAFIAEVNKSHLFDLRPKFDSETEKPFHSTMQNVAELLPAVFADGQRFSEQVDENVTELKNEKDDFGHHNVGNASSSTTSQEELRSVTSGIVMKETDDSAAEGISFSQLTAEHNDKLRSDKSFPDGSGDLHMVSASSEANSVSTALVSSVSDVAYRSLDDRNNEELHEFEFRSGSLPSCNSETDEILEKSVGHSPLKAQPVEFDCVVGPARMNGESGKLNTTISDFDEKNPRLFSGKASSSLPADGVSGNCNSNNSSRSGSVSSMGGKMPDASVMDDSAARKVGASNQTTSSSNRIGRNVAVSVNSTASNSDSSQTSSLASAHTRPHFSQSTVSSLPSSSYEVPQNIALSLPLSSNIDLPITRLGRVAPTWLPDSEASRCMECDAAFSFTRRRHHCRACGKIFCGNCSSLKASLHYLENKESRVCSKCYQDLVRAQYYQKVHRKLQLRPNPNNPSEYCSVISPLLQVQSLAPASLPSIMVPTSGVLRKQGSFKSKSETKQVMFSDGIRPGGDLTEVDGVSCLRSALDAEVGHRRKRVEMPGPNTTTVSGDLSSGGKLPVVSKQSTTCLIPAFGGLPPVVVNSSSNKGFSLMDSPTVEFVLHHLRNADCPIPVSFVIDRFLAVIVNIVNLDCCVNRVCWSFTTKGMRSVGQDEIIILLECFPDERTFPVDIFHHLHSIYQKASEGSPVTPMGHTIFPPGCFGCSDHGGFLFIRQTFQCMERLVLPEPPYLFGILLQKWEIVWAKVFPLRLLLRLGAEFRYYPCPLVGVRNRRPVYGEIGHTIMNLLADFHNYQYMVPQIAGLVIHLEAKQTTVKIPSSRYDAVMKVLNGTNGHVLALGADFSASADSHLVCVQNDDGNYQTKSINHQKKTCKVTGASFVVFNGALKPATGTLAKSSVVEDGVMIQVTPSMMSDIKQSWKDMKNYTIACGSASNDDIVSIEWTDDCNDSTINNEVKSPIDGMSLSGKESRRIHNATDFAYDDHVIRWTEIFLLCNETNESTNIDRLIDLIAQTACKALVPHSPQLTGDQMSKIGLRVTVGLAEVSFKAGSNNQTLPESCIYDLEEKLLPLLQKFVSSSPSSAAILTLPSSSSAADCHGNLVVELIFNILHLSSMIASTYAINLPD